MTLNPLRINYLFVTYSGKICSLFKGPKLSQNIGIRRLLPCYAFYLLISGNAVYYNRKWRRGI